MHSIASFIKNKKSLVTAVALLFFLIGKTQSPARHDSITLAIDPSYDSVNSLHRFWLGEGYRKLWAVPVPVKVFDFNRASGGIAFLKTGGGLQTKSLRYKDAEGKEWVLRSVRKYPERGLTEALRKTILKSILHDQVITEHPYAALTVPPFARALGIIHTEPRLVYMPDDPLLQNYRADFANSVLLLEQREPGDSIDTDNTEKVQRKLEEDHDNSVDQRAVLRARLLDILLGDWDRHEDQWRWKKAKHGDDAVYIPFPRDRDNVYYNTTGVFPWILSHQYLKSKFQGFHKNIRDINGFNFNNRYFDRYFLNALSEEDWLAAIDFVQAAVTDSVIAEAMKAMPAAVFALSADELTLKLRERRANLKKVALTYYRFLSATVDVAASDKQEVVNISYKPGAAEVVIYKQPKGRARGKIIYQREFSATVTKEIRLYGLGGDDVFEVRGTAPSSIKLRLIGGDGRDSFLVADGFVQKKNVVVYDRSDSANYYTASGLHVRTSTDSSVNFFDRKQFVYNRSGPIISLLANMDVGALTTLGWIREKQGFRKQPYASHQELKANYSISTQAFTISYLADWRKLIGNYDLTVNAISQGPNGRVNFFGVGNNTVFINPGKNSINYYRNRYNLANVDVRLKRKGGNNFWWSAGLASQYYSASVKKNNTKFLGSYAAANPAENVFAGRFHAGVVAGVKRYPEKAGILPSRGFYFIAEAKAMRQLNGAMQSYGAFVSQVELYLRLTKDSGVVFYNRVGGGTTVGQPQYYQMMQLGGEDNLRGYNTNRFTGRTMLYHNAELRVKLFSIESYLFPATIGLIGFNDVGRVWMPNQTSSTWHHGYGGGIYLAPADLVLFRFLVGHSAEITQGYLNVAFSL